MRRDYCMYVCKVAQGVEMAGCSSDMREEEEEREKRNLLVGLGEKLAIVVKDDAAWGKRASSLGRKHRGWRGGTFPWASTKCGRGTCVTTSGRKSRPTREREGQLIRRLIRVVRMYLPGPAHSLTHMR